MKKYIVLLVCIASSMHGTMHIHEALTELFKRDPVITEYAAYKVFKELPLEVAVNYVAIPWAVLINKGQLSKVPPLKLDGGFTICQHIHYERIIPLLKSMGLDTLFTPHVPLNKQYNGITVLPFPHYPVCGADPAPHKDILYSFVGCTNTHNVRKQIMKLPKAKDVVLIDRVSWHFGRRSEKEEKKQYQDILARSRFSLCPRGTGASTIRFWESMQAGAIPVLISDAMALPPEIDWNLCCIRVPQNKVHLIDEIIRSIPLEVEEEMRAYCLDVFQLFYGDNFVHTIKWYYEQKKRAS